MATPKKQRIDPKTVPAPSVAQQLKAAQLAQAKSAKARRQGAPAPVVRKATLGDWIAGARLQTLSLAIAPVALGTATAYVLPHEETGPGWHWLRALLCLAVAVFLQIGVNYANDYSDGIRGTDKYRVGPSRLTGSGAAKPTAVLAVALVFFALGAAAGVAIVVRTGSGGCSRSARPASLAAWFYTGGKRPYGYYGLGEVFVFVFFGLVATAGTTFVPRQVTLDSWLAGVAIGLIACAALMVNNIRDIAQDRVAGKRTLADAAGRPGQPRRVRRVAARAVRHPRVLRAALRGRLPRVLRAARRAAGGAHHAHRTHAGRTRDRAAAHVARALLYGLGLGWAIAF